jgi:uncharacterized membrane protein
MAAKTKRVPWIVRVVRARLRLAICTAIGVAVAVALPSGLTLDTRALLGWDTALLIYLVLVARVMARGSIAHIKRQAAAQDEGAVALLALTVAAAAASLGAIFAEFAAVERSNPHYGLYVALAIATVVLFWAFIHTIFALHYAHEFYGEHDRANGLKFPDNHTPDYWDFMYFAFVIGMTFQVSDVAITNKWIRRTVVIHGALAFFFTTAIVALTVNIAASVMQR